MKRNNWWILLCIFFSIPALLGILHSGFFVSDDGQWMIIRLTAFYQALVSGQFPVRFLPRLNMGTGYPVADFLYPLFLYIGSFLHVVKIPFILDIKVILILSIVLSGVGMYIFLHKYFSSFSSLVGSLVYIYLPYHLFDIYTRGSVGEIVALAIAPFIFYFLKKSVLLSSIGIALLIIAHNSLALLFLPVILAYSFVMKYPIKKMALLLIFSLGLSAFFWFPALYDKQFTVFDGIAVANSSHYFINATLSLVGWIGLLIFLGSFFLKPTKQTIFFWIIGLGSLYLSTSWSALFWHILPLGKFVQFPFRFLSLTLMSEGFFAAGIIEKFPKKIVPTILFLGILFLSCSSYILPKQYDYHDDAYFATNMSTTTVQNEYMPKWVMHVPTTISDRVLVPNGSTQVIEKGTKLSFVSHLQKSETIAIGFTYFPGWIVLVDGKNTAVFPDKNGLVACVIPSGEHAITVSFQETPFRIFADIVSVITLATIVFCMYKKYEK